MSKVGEMAYLRSIGNAEAVEFFRALAREENPNLDDELKKVNGMKQYEPVDITPILKKHQAEERMKKDYKNAEQIYQFCVQTAVKKNDTFDYTSGYKHIYCHNKTKDVFHQLCFYTQRELGKDEKDIQSFDVIKTISFRKNTNYYITKNSFIRDIRRTEYLFSFDNIVIDVDNHSENATKEMTVEEISIEVDKLIKCLDVTEDFLRFSYIRTGRGVHIWIRLESFSARTSKLQKLYDIFCEKLCDIVERVVAENHINLQVDRGASTDKTRLVRLPYTYNTKAKKRNGKCFKTKYSEHTARKYSLDELCAFFDIQKKTEKPKQLITETVKPRPQLNTDTDYVGLYIKRLHYLENIVKRDNNCTSRRNNLLFCYYATCVKIYPQQQAQELVFRLNNAFSDPLKHSDVQATIRSVDNNNYTKLSISKFFALINATKEEIALYDTFSKRRRERKKAREEKDKRNQTIKELSKEMTVREIATQLDCSIETVCKYSDSEYNKPVDYEKILELYKKGLKQKDIAKKLECSEGVVSKALKQYKPNKKEVIIDLFESGMKQVDIVKQTGYSKSTVIRVLKEYKIQCQQS